MIVLVCGGREYNETVRIHRTLAALHKKRKIEKLVCGGARGADQIAARWALANNVDLRTINAEWDKHGKAAGILRNKRMLMEEPIDLCVVFPGGRGTLAMRNMCEEAKIEILSMEDPWTPV